MFPLGIAIDRLRRPKEKHLSSTRGGLDTAVKPRVITSNASLTLATNKVSSTSCPRGHSLTREHDTSKALGLRPEIMFSVRRVRDTREHDVSEGRPFRPQTSCSSCHRDTSSIRERELRSCARTDGTPCHERTRTRVPKGELRSTLVVSS